MLLLKWAPGGRSATREITIEGNLIAFMFYVVALIFQLSSMESLKLRRQCQRGIIKSECCTNTPDHNERNA